MRDGVIDLVDSRKWLFLFSGVLALAAVVVLAIPPTLRPGIEFTSGTTALLRFEQPLSQTDLRQAYHELGHPEARIQSTGPNEFLVRTGTLEIPASAFVEVAPTPTAAPVGPTPVPDLGTLLLGATDQVGEIPLLQGTPTADGCPALGEQAGTRPWGTRAQVIAVHTGCGEGGTLYRVVADGLVGYVPAASIREYTPAATPTPEPPTAAANVDPGNERAVIEAGLRDRFGNFEVREFAQVSPVVSRAAVRNASVAVVVASVFILAYIAFAFASVPRPLLYGTCAVVAMLHDVVITLGIFSFLGKAFGLEVNLMFVTGLLTVIGFSVHDTIVVFDRIRENIRLHPTLPLPLNVNAALLQTLARSLNTSVTVLLTVVALLLLGGSTIREFLLVILVGVIAGTYSSVAVASQLLVAYEEGDFARLWARIRGRRPEPQAAS